MEQDWPWVVIVEAGDGCMALVLIYLMVVYL